MQDPSKKEMNEQLATSVLVAGDRGFGKTTVLLSAAAAFQQPQKFFLTESGTIEGEAQELYQQLEFNRKRIIWLDLLDMEPLPTEANLLATLLVRVRDVLGSEGGREGGRAASSSVLLEEGAEDPWSKIDPLVRQATFMWEDIPVEGQDPRQRAEYQLRAAEIYAGFRRKFFEALNAVSNHLALRSGLGKDEGTILILPIDNVDRSIQHLHLILKLTRMVASRRLWFLLASGQQEFQLFLERTFQKELTQAGEDPLGARSEDETRSIARRQAAAAMRRVLPLAHRIDIRSLHAEEVWNYKAPASLTHESKEGSPLCEELKKLPLPMARSGSHHLERFADLFDVRERLLVEDDGRLLDAYRQSLRDEEDNAEQATGEPSRKLAGAGAAEPAFTYAGRLALAMSARSALDFWQEARNAVQKKDRGQEPGEPHLNPGELSICIARRMLLMAIDESDLPSWASEQLLHRILREDSQKRILLDLSREPIRRLKSTVLSDSLELPRESPGKTGVVLRSELHLRHFRDVILELQDLEKPGRSAIMPPLVSGWFMLLHDLLMLTEERRVLTRRVVPFEATPELLVTKHEVLLRSPQAAGALKRPMLVDLDFLWLLPVWDSFIDSLIFTMQWRAFLHRIKGLFKADVLFARADSASARKQAKARLSRFIRAAWIDNVCTVSGATRGQWNWKGLDAVYREDKSGSRFDETALARYERSVAEHVQTLYDVTQDDSIRYGRLRIARDWLDFFLPLMLRSEFMPGGVSGELKKEFEKPGQKPSRQAQRKKEARQKNGGKPVGDAWAENESLLMARQGNMVRDAVERSDAYRLLVEAYGKTPELCRDWLEAASQSWFAARGPKAS